MSRTGKNLKVVSALQLAVGLILSYLGARWALLHNVGWIFGLSILFVLPLGVWVGSILVKAFRSMVRNGVVYFESQWQEACGPRNIYLILYLINVVGLALMAGSLFYTFSSVEQAIALARGPTEAKMSDLATITGITLGIGATLWTLVSAQWLLWCVKYEKENRTTLLSLVSGEQQKGS